MSDLIYLVSKVQHDYEGSFSTPVHAFLDEHEANQFVKGLQAEQEQRIAAADIAGEGYAEFEKVDPRTPSPNLRMPTRKKKDVKQHEKAMAEWRKETEEWTKHALSRNTRCEAFVRQYLVDAGIDKEFIEEYDKTHGRISNEEFSFEIDEIGLD